MEEKKNNKGLIWLLVILIVLVLGLVGYIVYDKVLSEQKNSINNDETTTTTITTKIEDDKNKITKVDINSELIKDLYLLVPDNDLEVFSEIEYKGAYQNKFVDFNDLSTATILRTAIKQYSIENPSSSYFTIDDLEQYIYKIFNNKLPLQQMKIDDYILIYDSQTIRWRKNYVGTTSAYYDLESNQYSLVQLKFNKDDLINSQKYYLKKAIYNRENKEYYIYDDVYYYEIFEDDYNNHSGCDGNNEFKINIYDSFQQKNIVYTTSIIDPYANCIDSEGPNHDNTKSRNVLNEIKENYVLFEYKHTFKINEDGNYYWYSSELAKD